MAGMAVFPELEVGVFAFVGSALRYRFTKVFVGLLSPTLAVSNYFTRGSGSSVARFLQVQRLLHDPVPLPPGVV